MTLNRMGTARRKSNRKAWLTTTLALGALVATGGVAMGAHNEEPEQKVKNASQSLQAKGSDSERDDSEESARMEVERIKKGQVCLKLDKKAQKAIAGAAAKAQSGTITVPLNKVEVVPCTTSSKPAPIQPPALQPPALQPPAPKPTTTAPAPLPPAPKPITTAPAPKPPAPKPIVTSTAS